MNYNIEDVRSQIAGGMSEADVIGLLSRQGCVIVEAIKAIRELYGMSLGDAKNLVASHPAYQQVVTASIPLQDAIIQEFQAG